MFLTRHTYSPHEKQDRTVLATNTSKSTQKHAKVKLFEQIELTCVVEDIETKKNIVKKLETHHDKHKEQDPH